MEGDQNMASHAVPQGREADQRWKDLDRRRRTALLGGAHPADREEAKTALGYGHRMRSRANLFAWVGALGAFAVAVAVALLMEGQITTRTFVMAGGIAVGVGFGFEVAGRWWGRRLERNGREALDAN